MHTVPSCTADRVETGSVDVYLNNYFSRLGARRVFLVTGTKSFAWFDDRDFVSNLKTTTAVERWSASLPNPDILDLHEGLICARSFGPDVVVGIGGGGAMDLAKLIAAGVDNDAEVGDFLDFRTNFDARITPLVLVPTTAGSGAEATHFSVLYSAGIKHSIAGASLIANCIALDPALVLSNYPHQLASSGLDSLSQCIESIWSRQSNASSEKFAEEGLRILSEHLASFGKGDFSRASEMQWASHLSGQAINISRTTAPHALSYHLTARYQVPHGIAVASTIGYFIDHHNQALRINYSKDFEKLGGAMDIINEILGVGGQQTGRDYFQSLFSELKLNQPQEYWPREGSSHQDWIDSANPERLGNHPTNLPTLRQI